MARIILSLQYIQKSRVRRALHYENITIKKDSISTKRINSIKRDAPTFAILPTRNFDFISQLNQYLRNFLAMFALNFNHTIFNRPASSTLLF